MNRRELLQALSVLSAGGAWTFLFGSSSAGEMPESAPEQNDSLLLALADSAAQCDQLLAQGKSVFESHGEFSAGTLRELTCLIGEARLRLLKQRSDSPAFWQACGDAFLRTAESIASCSGAQFTQNVDPQRAEETFRRTAQLLTFEISRSTRRYAA